MTWPIDEDGAPITFVYSGRIREGRAEWIRSNMWQGVEHGSRLVSSPYHIELNEENLGIVWARGWDTKEAQALRVVAALLK